MPLRSTDALQYEGDASDLGLDFTVEDETFGRRTVQELCANGADVPVTNENKLQYVHLMADFHLNTRIQRPAAAFAAGLTQVLTSSSTLLLPPLSLGRASSVLSA